MGGRSVFKSSGLAFYRAIEKKSPALTLAQAQRLLATILEQGKMTPEKALAILAYRQKRNHEAYRAHRKTTLRRLEREKIQLDC